MFGTGQTKQETCIDGTCPGTVGTDFTDRSWVALGLDGLVHATRGLRLGLGYWVMPYSALGAEPNKATTVHLGSEHELNVIVEGIAPLRPHLALALRAQGGPRMLVSGGDLADTADSFLATCQRSPVDRCEADKGPFFGGQFTTTVGLLFGDRIRARADLGVERYAVKTGERQILDGSSERASTTTLSGTRFWVLAGVEL